jgi:rhodanese-related sulfurtransferase
LSNLYSEIEFFVTVLKEGVAAWKEAGYPTVQLDVIIGWSKRR